MKEVGDSCFFLLGATSGDQLGSAVATSGNTLILGVRPQDFGSDGLTNVVDAGSAFLTTRSGNTWTVAARFADVTIPTLNRLGSINSAVGQESVQWTGSIAMNPVPLKSSVIGLAYSFEFVRNGILVVPLWFQYLNVPKRQLKFDLFPNDKVSIEQGSVFLEV